MLTGQESLVAVGADYLRMTSFSYLFMSFSQIYMIIMKNTDMARKSSVIGGVSAMCNIGLNYLLIFGRLGISPLGAVGAGLATSIARLIEAAIVLTVCLRRKDVHFELKGLFGSYRALRAKFLHYSLPSLVKAGQWILASSVLVAIIGHMGPDVVAAQAVVMIVFNLASAISDGLATAAGIHLGKLLGSGKQEEAKADARRCILAAAVVGAVVVAAIILLRPVLPALNARLTPEARANLSYMLIIICFRVFGKSLNMLTTYGMLCTGGDVRFINILDGVNMWLVIVPLSLLSVYVLHLPFWAVYIIVNMDEYTKMFFQMRRVFSFKWVKDLTVKEWAEPGRYENEVREQILMNVPVGVLLIGSYGHITYANAAAERILNVSAEAMEGRSLVKMFVEDGGNDDFANLIIDALHDKKQIHSSKIVYRTGGEEKELSLSTMLIEEEDLRIGICATITEAGAQA